MSTTAKTGIGLVIILVILVIGWFIFSKPTVEIIDNESLANNPVVEQPTPEPILPNTAGTGLSDETDVTTEAITNDIDAVGRQFDGINQDAVNADAGLTAAKEIK